MQRKWQRKPTRARSAPPRNLGSHRRALRPARALRQQPPRKPQALATKPSELSIPTIATLVQQLDGLSTVPNSKKDDCKQAESKAAPFVHDEFEVVDVKETKSRIMQVKPLQALLPLLKGMGTFGMDRWSGFLYGQTNVTYNSSAAKYLQFFNATTTSSIRAVASAPEFTTLDALYDECYVHSAQYTYKPRNKFSGTYAAGGTAADLGTCIAVVACLQHFATPYTDAVNTFSSMRSQRISKVVDLGAPWSITWRNNERFDWRGPLGDQSTAATTQSWCQNYNVAALYGGYLQLCTPVNTGATLGIGTLVEGAIPGDISVKYHISMRARG